MSRAFKVGLPYLMCGYILGRVVSLTVSGHSDLDLWPLEVFEKSYLEHISNIFEKGIRNLICGYHIGAVKYLIWFLGHYDLRVWSISPYRI